MKRTILAAAFALGAASVALAQAPAGGPPRAPGEADGGHIKGLASVTAKPASGAPAKLTVTSPSFKAGGDIPFENTQYRGNHFPGLNWSKGPAGTKSYAVFTQGALGAGDDLSGGTSIHFVMYDIPAGVTKIGADADKPPAGAAMGNTVHGMKDFYAGPHTHNFTKHAYHYQVVALDETVPVDPKMTLTNLVKLMDGHVLATGEIVGLVAMDPDSDEGKAFIAKQGAAKPAAAKD